MANGDRHAPLAHDAIVLAVVVTGLAEHLGERVLPKGETGGLIELLPRDEVDVSTAVLRDRATLNAVGHRTLQAALTLQHRLLDGVGVEDLAEALETLLFGLLGYRRPYVAKHG